LVDVRDGRSRSLVLRGEAGVGKSALLEYLLEASSGFTVARAAGIESEMELPFAGLQQLCAPFLDHLDHLPAPQRDALSTAFGLTPGRPPERFLVGLAVLSLLADVAERSPLICVVDDVQWLDRVSAQTLTFVARRLLAERVALVFAIRGHGDEGSLAGLRELVIRGLEDGDARALLDSAIPGRLDDRVRDRIIAETRGNPLALLELPQGLTPAEVAGGFGLPDAVPLATRIEQSFLRRLEHLPVPTRRLLLTAAAEPIGDVNLLWRAAERLGLEADAATPAEATGLIQFNTRVRFRHPLVRSAAYRAASPSERQAVHRALAEATDPDSDPDRRAWHGAHATVGRDDALAADLERSADRARRRGGVAAAAAFLARATELTSDRAERGARALAAAQAKFEAASPDAAYELLGAAELCPLDALQLARLHRLRAQILFARRRGSDAPPLLLEAAKELEQVDPALARETYLETLTTAIFTDDFRNLDEVRDIAAAARSAPLGHRPPRPIDLLLDGLATQFTDGHLAAMPRLREALDASRRESLDSQDDIMRWLWLASPITQETAAHALMDDEAWAELATRAVALAREAGALAVLPGALVYRAGVHLHAGELAAASALIEEADAITAATGYAPVRYTSLVLSAWRGQEAETLRLLQDDVADATARGEGRVVGLSGYVTAVLYNGLSQYETALDGARQACAHEHLGFFGWSLAELVEAGVRSGERTEAASALTRLEERAHAAGTDWALGLNARSQALMGDGDDADALYREAIERLGRTRMVIHVARARLVYGEWLRRENRRLDAREHLLVAHETFTRIGAGAFAERSRRELLATGQTVRERTVDRRDHLTPQETQIARLAADRHTNPEIGAQLFISPRTVEYHLRKVFAKLEINSRRELRAALPDAEQTPAGA
jgi:DNA-binding CsgD family transcriptional regulator